ncbi:PREDICTED: growth arrest-specific protein 2-like, partial [Dinoponera quadriceps]|uniref:Growth arrest-specific protein 2-like n=1 Tax=Dinoponera quadriceps TaxID=609295 RepID=A0A6P3XJB0_DINQU
MRIARLNSRRDESVNQIRNLQILDVDYITGDNFFDMLDNGAIVCRLARVIQEKARSAIDAGRAKGLMPVIRGRCWENAARRSFFSRDNMENFIQFCRRLGVHENLLFESDDLVLHGQPRNVVLCLLEVARLAAQRYSLEPPGLVQLEREIAAEQERDLHCLSDSGISHSSLVSWQFQSPSPTATPRTPLEKIKHS